MEKICQLYIIHLNKNQFKKRKQFSLLYAVCESVAMGESLVGHVPSKENVVNGKNTLVVRLKTI